MINNEVNVDNILGKLLKAIGNKPGISLNLKEEEITYLIEKSLNLIKKENILIELKPPIKICGDIFGQFYDLLRIFGHVGYPGKNKYLFLGNYVDYGKQSIETICLLLSYKIKFPDKLFLLRGNHESSKENILYGFYDECKRRYNVNIWKKFTNLFNYFPIAAIIEENIFCIHGGLCPELKDPKDILKISRPTEIPDEGFLCDLLWSDPDKDVLEFDKNCKDDILGNKINKGVIFGEKVVENFIKKNNLDLIVRGHEIVDNGYEFFASRQLITLFSAGNFKGEFDNSSGTLLIDESLICSLKVFRPVEKLEK